MWYIFKVVAVSRVYPGKQISMKQTPLLHGYKHACSDVYMHAETHTHTHTETTFP